MFYNMSFSGWIVCFFVFIIFLRTMEKANQLPWIRKCHKEIQVQLFLLSIIFFLFTNKTRGFFLHISFISLRFKFCFYHNKNVDNTCCHTPVPSGESLTRCISGKNQQNEQNGYFQVKNKLENNQLEATVCCLDLSIKNNLWVDDYFSQKLTTQW